MTLPIHWSVRRTPLTPVAVVAQGSAARRMAQRLLARNDETLALLNSVSGSELLVILGDETALPWVDGAIYLGHDAAAPALLLPTALEPSVPLPLLEHALRRHAPGLMPPFAAIPVLNTFLSLAAARPVARDTLLLWLETNR